MFLSFRHYWRSFADYGGRAIPLVGAILLLGAALEGIGLLALLPFLDLFTGGAPNGVSRSVSALFAGIGIEARSGQLVAILAVFLMLIALRGLVSWLRVVRLAALSRGFVDHWRMRIFHAMGEAEWARLAALEKHEAIHAVTSDVGRLATGTDAILRGATTILLAAVQVAIAMVVAPALTAIILAFVAILGGIAFPLITRRARLLGEMQTRLGRGLQQTLHQFLAGLKLAKVYGHSGYTGRAGAVTDALRRDAIRYVSQNAVLNGVLQFASALMACIVLIVGLFVLRTPTAELVLVLLIMVRISAPVFGLLTNAQSVANMLPAFEHLTALERSLVDARERHDAATEAGAAGEAGGPIGFAFENLSSGYPGQDLVPVRDVSFSVAPGSMVALVGQSGSGKTTLLDLLAGLLRPHAGAVMADGESIADPAVLTRLRSRIAYVPQDPPLHDATLAENLSWYGAKPSAAEIADALDIAGASDFVARLPQGLATRMGDRGQMLSGGERQRVCIASALLRRPGLLILDEATSAIDRATEARILSQLRAMTDRMTILVVTHRPAERGMFDAIWEIADGMVTRRAQLD